MSWHGADMWGQRVCRPVSFASRVRCPVSNRAQMQSFPWYVGPTGRIFSQLSVRKRWIRAWGSRWRRSLASAVYKTELRAPMSISLLAGGPLPPGSPPSRTPRPSSMEAPLRSTRRPSNGIRDSWGRLGLNVRAGRGNRLTVADLLLATRLYKPNPASLLAPCAPSPSFTMDPLPISGFAKNARRRVAERRGRIRVWCRPRLCLLANVLAVKRFSVNCSSEQCVRRPSASHRGAAPSHASSPIPVINPPFLWIRFERRVV
jgi:hypothetical protein